MGKLKSKLELRCYVSASPKAEISWYRKGRKLLSNCNTTYCVYTIPKLSEEHSGEYYCNATNSQGVTMKVLNVSVSGIIICFVFFGFLTDLFYVVSSLQCTIGSSY